MAGPDWKLEDDYRTVTLTFPTNPQVVLKLDTAAIEEMLHHLGEFRGLMQPEVQPLEWPGRQQVGALPGPSWYTEPDALAGETLLHIRDLRYGWLHYMIPREQARELARLLQQQVDTPPPGHTSGKAN